MTKGVGTYAINAFWESGRLIYYEKTVGHTTTGDVFIIGADYVQVGDTLNDVDFAWKGTTTGTFTLDAAAHTAVTTGLAWTITGNMAITGDVTLTGDLAVVATGDIALAQGYYLYLDGDDGGEYLVSDTANQVMLNATTTINLAIGGTDEVSVSSTAVTLATNDLTLSAGAVSVAQGKSVYLDGLNGGEYLVSDAANEATLNATTTLNLAIGGSDKISMVAATTTVNNDLVITAGEFISGAPVKQLITDKTGGQTLTAAEAGVIRVTTDDVYIYLPTYIGNIGLTYTIKETASYSVGAHVRGNGTELIDANNVQTNGATNDFITIIATLANGWNVIGKTGTWTGTN